MAFQLFVVLNRLGNRMCDWFEFDEGFVSNNYIISDEWLLLCEYFLNWDRSCFSLLELYNIHEMNANGTEESIPKQCQLTSDVHQLTQVSLLLAFLHHLRQLMSFALVSFEKFATAAN